MNKAALKQLKSRDIAERKQAIKELAKSGDADAIPHLKRVFEQDPEPEVREFAKKAAAYIRKNTPEPTPKSTGLRLGIVQWLMAWLVILGAFVAFVGYFLFPWVDLSEATHPNLAKGYVMNVGEQVEFYRERFHPDNMNSLRIFFPTIDQLLDSVDALTVQLNGWDTTLVMMDTQTIFNVVGLDKMLDRAKTFLTEMEANDHIGLSQLEIILEDYPGYGATPSDFAMLLIPGMAGLGIILGVMLFYEKRIIFWILTILCSVVGLAAAGYFYFIALEKLLFTDAVIETPEAINFLGLGFFITVAGLGVVLFAPFVGLLLMPGGQDG